MFYSINFYIYLIKDFNIYNFKIVLANLFDVVNCDSACHSSFSSSPLSWIFLCVCVLDRWVLIIFFNELIGDTPNATFYWPLIHFLHVSLVVQRAQLCYTVYCELFWAMHTFAFSALLLQFSSILFIRVHRPIKSLNLKLRSFYKI